VVGCLRAYFTYSHYLIAIDANGVFESVAIPELEQGDVQADVCRIEGVVDGYFFEEAG